jgi:hypothetical protein
VKFRRREQQVREVLMNRVKPVSVTLAIALIIIISSVAMGHSGGLDKNGCHTNRKTGDYHCHGAPAMTPSPGPTRSESPRSGATPRATSSALLSVQPSARASERDLVKTAQVLLEALGYHPSLLGILDARTQGAIRAFQRDQKLEPVGTVNEFLVLRLAEALAFKCR